MATIVKRGKKYSVVYYTQTETESSSKNGSRL